MNITILCDQIDCTFNSNDVCTHPHPVIPELIHFNDTPATKSRVCHSKDIRKNR